MSFFVVESIGKGELLQNTDGFSKLQILMMINLMVVMVVVMTNLVVVMVVMMTNLMVVMVIYRVFC